MDLQLREHKPYISIVAPIFNEEDNIVEFYQRCKKTLLSVSEKWEIIFVDDGSSDKSLGILIELNRKDPNVKIIKLSRNFGKELALTSGLDLASGEVIVPIDSDLQDPPELIIDMIELWKKGYDVVLAVRSHRKNETWLKKTTATLFYKLIEKISETRIPRNTGDFRLIDRKVLNSVNELRETNRFMKGVFSWVGYTQTTIEYDRDGRYAGESKWNYWKLWNFAIEGITSFSTFPLKIATYLGFLVSFGAIFFLLFIVFRTLFYGVDVPGYASTLTLILFLGGLILMFLGIIGEYIGRIYLEVKERPLYIIESSLGFTKEND